MSIFKGNKIYFNILLFTFLFIFRGTFAQSQEIGGQVNHYAKVIKFLSDCSLISDSAAAFQPLDKVLIIQMKGAEIDTSESINYGKLKSFKKAGTYEISTVSYVNGDTIFLRNKISKSYNVNHSVQIIGFPSYSSVHVTSESFARSWDGNKGGVLFLDVKDTIVLEDDINTTGQGYRGGDKSLSNDVMCNYSNYAHPFIDGNGGRKGESFVEYGYNDSGRGPLGSGGGGGNNHNTGGGGGANFGNGGKGGKQAKGCGNTDVGGLGGISSNSFISQNLLFMGSGGGGGHQNKSTQSSDGVSSNGGNGGGLIIISCNTLIHNGNLIRSNGNDVLTVAENDGAGGGGAGGTVLLNVVNLQSGLSVYVNGGNGGNVDNYKRVNDYHGPGGGGGGGLIWTNNFNLSKINPSFGGGTSGIIYYSNNPSIVVQGGANYASENGTDGAIRDGVELIENTNLCDENIKVKAKDLTFQGIQGVSTSENLKTNNGINDPVEFVILELPENGDATIKEDSIYYTPYEDFEGIDSLEYKLCKNTSPVICDIGKVYFEVNPDPRVIDGNNDFGVVVDGNPIALDIRENDSSDVPVKYGLVTKPKYGIANLDENGKLNYIPNEGISATDTFIYQICTEDLPEKCNQAYVIIEINRFNNPPSANNDTIFIKYGVETIIYPIENDFDIDGDSIAVDTVYNSGIGEIIISEGEIYYKPSPKFVGVDTFKYQIIDNGNPQKTALATLVLVVEEPENLIIPNGFSPNNDGLNDSFKIIGLDQFSTHSITIFNRWGQKVYWSDNYKNNWTGISNNGGSLPDGTYYYLITVDKNFKTYSGYVVIKK
ncbi:gliding motility-associated C-terminal domain-containing protein [Flexithrix dorotheae]|uniref:T9SS type B sorting domain-containing protein n=1 Tax=Flexithrix dorotheae TaxID=70993 RepID=UPI000376FD47|nr:Ig-like domain-containing protein [Flexithrix dorotheae]